MVFVAGDMWAYRLCRWVLIDEVSKDEDILRNHGKDRTAEYMYMKGMVIGGFTLGGFSLEEGLLRSPKPISGIHIPIAA